MPWNCFVFGVVSSVAQIDCTDWGDNTYFKTIQRYIWSPKPYEAVWMNEMTKPRMNMHWWKHSNKQTNINIRGWLFAQRVWHNLMTPQQNDKNNAVLTTPWHSWLPHKTISAYQSNHSPNYIVLSMVDYWWVEFELSAQRGKSQ
jgi:hypothetical protein